MVESHGPINSDALQLLSELGSWRLVMTGNVKATSFLLQRILVQRFNSVLLHDGFIDDDRSEYRLHYQTNSVAVFVIFEPPVVKSNRHRHNLPVCLCGYVCVRYMRCRRYSKRYTLALTSPSRELPEDIQRSLACNPIRHSRAGTLYSSRDRPSKLSFAFSPPSRSSASSGSWT